MPSLEHEVRELASAGEADAASAAAAIALESRAVFSVRAELLAVLYMAIAMVVGGVGLLVRANLDRIGPAALTAALFAVAAICYALALRPTLAGRERSLGLDYVLLLGALLTSSAVAYAEVRFHWLGAGWSRHLLILAVWHFATAYGFGSRLLLSVALAGFAAWLGIEPRFGDLWRGDVPWQDLGWRALGCALLYAAGAWLHARGARPAAFRDVFETFAANLSLAGALAVGFSPGELWVGAALLVALAFAIGRYGLARRRESLVLFAIGYGTIGVIGLEARLLDGAIAASNLGLLTVIGAVLLMLRLRARLKESAG